MGDTDFFLFFSSFVDLKKIYFILLLIFTTLIFFVGGPQILELVTIYYDFFNIV